MKKTVLIQYGKRLLLVALAAIALVFLALELAEDEATEGALAGGSEPAVVEQLAGTSLSRVRLSSSAAERLGLETATVQRRRGSRKAVPYSAILYDPRGRTWVYTSPERLTFVRAPIAIASIRGDVAFLSAGPPVGMIVATVGAAELYGAEFEVDH